MSNDRRFWEEKFVDACVVDSKQARYKTLLRDPRKRGKVLDQLNHTANLDFSKSLELAGAQTFADVLNTKLDGFQLDEQCYLISGDPDLDGKPFSWIEGIQHLVDAYSGTLIICPPTPIVVYRPESPSKIFYLFI